MAFKICLIRSKNTKVYTLYYLLLEECIKYFNDYQLELKEKYIIEYINKIDKQDLDLKFKDDKINKLHNVQELLKKKDEILSEVRQLTKSNKRLEKRDHILEDKLNDTNGKIDDVKDDLEDANFKLDKTFKKLNIAVEKNTYLKQ